MELSLKRKIAGYKANCNRRLRNASCRKERHAIAEEYDRKIAEATSEHNTKIKEVSVKLANTKTDAPVCSRVRISGGCGKSKGRNIKASQSRGKGVGSNRNNRIAGLRASCTRRINALRAEYDDKMGDVEKVTSLAAYKANLTRKENAIRAEYEARIDAL